MMNLHKITVILAFIVLPCLAQASVIIRGNQIAYDIGQPKQFMVESSTSSMDNFFFYLKRSDDNGTVLTDTLYYAGEIPGWHGEFEGHHYWRGDFTEFDEPGEYYITALVEGDSVDSYPFRIGRNALEAMAARLSYEFFSQRRATASNNPWGHEGGWRADWISGHYPGDTPLLGLLLCYEQNPSLYERWDFYNHNSVSPGLPNGIPDIIDEILWGLVGEEFGDVGFGSICNLAKAAQCSWMNEDQRQHYYNLAYGKWDSYKDTPNPYPNSDQYHWTRWLAEKIRGSCEMYELSGHDVTIMNNYVLPAVNEFISGWQCTIPWPNTHREGWSPSQLIYFATRYPEFASAEVYTKIDEWIDHCIDWADNPYKVKKWNTEKFFIPTHNNLLGNSGNNASLAYAFLSIYKLTGDSSYLALGWNEINWLMGINPFNECHVNWIPGGENIWNHWYGILGDNRGAIPNGVTRTSSSDDTPCNNWGYHTNEPWTPHNGFWLLALSLLHEREIEFFHSDWTTPIEECSPGDTLYIQLKAALNLEPESLESGEIFVIAESDTEIVSVNEIGPDSGIFRGQIVTVESVTPIPGNDTLEVAVNTVAIVQYGYDYGAVVDTIEIVSVGVEVGNKNLSTDYYLSQNYPNPFSQTTSISYALPYNSSVEISIYNVRGQKVRTLVNGKQVAGYKSLYWDGLNDAGCQVSNGIYFCKMMVHRSHGIDNFTQIKKMLLLK